MFIFFGKSLSWYEGQFITTLVRFWLPAHILHTFHLCTEFRTTGQLVTPEV